MTEILSPAGDLERLKWALMYGADAVYIGGYNYSLRANANNFSVDDIKEAVTLAHSLNKKIYVTVNILFRDEDLKDLDDYLITLSDIGVDAFIVSDLAVIRRIKELNLKPEIHISTQESTLNKETALFWKNMGATRVVLGRECSKEDILDIIHSTESPENKKKLFSELVKRNLESPVSQLIECAKTFQHWTYEIKNSLEVPYSNGPIEGTNNKIKALKRTIFGMPNLKNFKARIMLLD